MFGFCASFSEFEFNVVVVISLLADEAAVTSLAAVVEIASSNARSVEEVASASEHLNSMTNNLSTELDKFKV